MAFEVFKPEVMPRDLGSIRKELETMFKYLVQNPDHTALSTVKQHTVLIYAQRLGYAMSTKRQGAKTLVWAKSQKSSK